MRIERTGICGSDLHIFAGHHPTATFPRVQGHEAGGIVSVLPADYAGPLSTGDRVAIDPIVSCGVCYACRIGRGNACSQGKVIGAHIDGCLQTLINVPAVNVYDARNLTADEAALVEPVSVGLQAIRRGAVQPAEHVVIFGAGPIGLCTAIAALDAGASVYMVDAVAQRLEYASRIGASKTHLADQPDLKADILEWTSGDGPPVSIDAVGAPAVIRQCCDIVSPAGRVVIVGLSDRVVELPIAAFTYKEMTILGSRASARLFSESIALIERHRGRVSQLVSHHFPLAETADALTFAASSQRDVVKVLIDVDS